MNLIGAISQISCCLKQKMFTAVHQQTIILTNYQYWLFNKNSLIHSVKKHHFYFCNISNSSSYVLKMLKKTKKLLGLQ